MAGSALKRLMAEYKRMFHCVYALSGGFELLIADETETEERPELTMFYNLHLLMSSRAR
jgi:hypothetical protein